MGMQLETCHLGRIQGRQVTRASGSHGGSRPRLSEEDRERRAQRRAFVSTVINKLIFGPMPEELSNTEAMILYKRYVQGKTQTEVSLDMLFCQQRISQIEAEALTLLRKTFGEG